MGCIGMSLEAIVHDASTDIVASCPICDETQAILHPIKQVFRSRLEHTLPSRPKATLLTLDLEVQNKLLSYIAPRDALRLSMTCRTAFKAALPRALSDIQVGMPRREGGVLTEKQFALFCEWVITDDTRPSLLTGFTIRRPAPLTQDLVDLLRRCKKLRRLWLEGSEAAFAHVPGLADAIIHLEDLDFVFFDSSGAHACSVLARMQSQPRTVRLINWDPTSNPSAGKLLSRPHVLCINTVVHLDLTDLSILRALAQDMVWPCVETLRVNRLTDVATTAAAFPNLRVLHVAEPCQATGVVSVRSLHNWAQLDSASVQSPLPLSRPVRRLHIGMITAEWVAEARGCDVPRMLARMLDETIPVVLGCTLGRWAKGRVLGEVARLPAVTKYLKYLQLSVVFDGDIERNRAGEEVEEWLKSELCSLRQTSLQAVAMYCYKAHWPECDYDCEKTARRYLAMLRECIPSLEYVGIGDGKADASVMSGTAGGIWFRIVPSQYKRIPPAITRLSQDHARTLVANLVEMPRIE